MALVEENCRTDYLTIEGSSSICRLNRLTNRYCGEFLADENKVEFQQLFISWMSEAYYASDRTKQRAENSLKSYVTFM